MNLSEDIKQSLLRKDLPRANVLRFLKASLDNEVKNLRRALSNQEEFGIIRREIKKRRESIEMFLKANRGDLVNREQNEIDIISGYLPQSFTADELSTIVKSIIDTLGAKNNKALGYVIKTINAQYPGRIDGKELAAEAKKQLGIS